MTALTVVAAVASYYVPFMTILLFFLPVPAVILALKQGFRAAAISSAASFLILFMFLTPYAAVSTGICAILPGLALGWAYQTKKSGFFRLFAGYLAYLVSFFVIIYLGQWVTGVSFTQDYVKSVEETSRIMLEMYKNAGLSIEELAQVTAQVENMTKSMKLFLPAIMLAAPFFMSLIACALSDFLLKRLRIPFVPMKPFDQWELAPSLKIFLGLVFLLSFFLEVAFPGIPEIYFATIEMLGMVIFIFMGFSFIFWLTRNMSKGQRNFLRIISFLLFFMVSGFSLVILLLGIVDVYVPVRRFISQRQTK